MKSKIILLILTVTCLLALFPSLPAADDSTAAMPTQATETKPDTASITPDSAHQVMAYYFHGTRRCSNCIKIETYSKEAIDSAYGAALNDGHLVWKVLNTDEDSNSHFIKDYQLYTKSVVLVDLHYGKQMRWKNLEKVWDYLNDKNSFENYIRDEVALFLKVD
jgi:hypothetical protein